MSDRIQREIKSIFSGAQFVQCPPFPDRVMFELSNMCNHSCVFCSHKTMTRKPAVIDKTLFRRLAKEAHDLGAKQIGLHNGAEPFCCPDLADHVAYASGLGYENVYLTTNGTIPGKKDLERVVDAGLNSIKFSINAGNREIYRAIHGKDHFEKAMENLRHVDTYRKATGSPIYLSVSFVVVPENRESFDELDRALSGVVDEIYKHDANNQSGQNTQYPINPLKLKCTRPFKTLNVTAEGYLNICCNDYENYLAIEDLNDMTLEQAWCSENFRSIRQRFIDKDLRGTLCQPCMEGVDAEIEPLNKALSADAAK